jgi:hypothetical protein
MVMALKLLHQLKDTLYEDDQIQKVDQMIKDIKKKLMEGYTKLATFETQQKGFEWFGNTPGHETLTAYGLA